MARKQLLPEHAIHSKDYIKDFFDRAVPSTIKFYVDYYICGDTYRSVYAIADMNTKRQIANTVTE